MLMPTIFGENLFDDWSGFPFRLPLQARKEDFDNLSNIERKLYGKNAARVMRTDVREKEDGFEIADDLPGFGKDEIEISLDDGYMTVKAEKKTEQDEKDKNGKLIRQERCSGSMQRSFRVGDELTAEDVKAKFENGVLTLTFPKKTPEVPEKKLIAIEG